MECWQLGRGDAEIAPQDRIVDRIGLRNAGLSQRRDQRIERDCS